MKVLFIGNSFTYFNEMQDIFQNLCVAAGHDVVARRRTVGGYGVEHHTDFESEHGKAVLADLAEGWDYAVIQGMSSQPALNRGLFLEKSKVLAEKIREFGAEPRGLPGRHGKTGFHRYGLCRFLWGAERGLCIGGGGK